MSHQRSEAVAPDGERVDGWPTRLAGVTETIVATEGPNGRWNQAALGVSPPEAAADPIEPGSDAPAIAWTFGRTRTRRNVDAGRAAYVQLTNDPLDFVEAALGTFETDEPILSSAAAWTRVEASEAGRTDERGTEIVEWSLRPMESGVRERTVPTLNRGRAAAIEATVPASRLDVGGYDEQELLDRLESLAAVVETAGDGRAAVAFQRIDELVGWRDRMK